MDPPPHKKKIAVCVSTFLIEYSKLEFSGKMRLLCFSLDPSVHVFLKLWGTTIVKKGHTHFLRDNSVNLLLFYKVQ